MSRFRFLTLDQLFKELDKYNHKELHVHHTWKPDHSDFNGKNHLKLQESMRHYHVNTRGWSDIGQHITLFPDGMIVTGRDFGETPGSIKGHNTGAFAVEMVGNFDVGHDEFKDKQKATMLTIARYFFDRGKYIRFHREDAPKTCPGTSIDKVKFMTEVKSLGKNKQTERRGRPLELKYQWQWEHLMEALEKLHKEGILSSSEWIEKARNKTLTVDEGVFLSLVVLGRFEKKEDVREDNNRINNNLEGEVWEG